MSAIDEAIREAMARGEFDNLPGQGKPLDLTAYFNTPEEVRMAHSILKSAGMLPHEVELLQEIAALKEKLAGTKDLDGQKRLLKRIGEKRLQLDILLERQKRPSKA